MARWGSSGRNFNVGLQDPGRLGATDRQIETLRRLDRRRYKGLTRDEASEKIQEAYDRRSTERAGLTSTEELYIEAIWRKAIKVANDAGERWLENNSQVKFVLNIDGVQLGIHGPIGRAWLTWPQRRTPLYKWLSEHYYELTGDRKEVHIPHRYADRYELGLQLACMEAAYKVFRNQGMTLGEVKLVIQSDEVPDRQAA